MEEDSASSESNSCQAEDFSCESSGEETDESSNEETSSSSSESTESEESQESVSDNDTSANCEDSNSKDELCKKDEPEHQRRVVQQQTVQFRPDVQCEHSPGPFARRQRRATRPDVVDVSVNFDPAPSTDLEQLPPAPTMGNQGDALPQVTSTENTPKQALQSNTTETATPPVDPSVIIKPSMETSPHDNESRTWRIIGGICLGIGVVLMLLVLILLIIVQEQETKDPQFEQYQDAIAVRNAAETVLQQLIRGAQAAAASISSRSLRQEWPVLDDFELLAKLTLANATILAPLVALEKRLEWQNFAKQNTEWVETSRDMLQASERIQRRWLQNGSAVLDSVKIDDAAIGDDEVVDSVTITGGDGVTTITDGTDDSTATDDGIGSGTFTFRDPTLPNVVRPLPIDDNVQTIQVPFSIHGSPRGDPLGRDDDAREYLPIWQLSPVPLEDLSVVNFDLLRQPLIRHMYEESKSTKRASISPPFGNSRVLLDDAFVFDGALTNETTTSPLFAILQPVFNRLPEPNIIAGFLLHIYNWEDLSWRSPSPVKIVVENSCGSASYAFEVKNKDVQYLGANALEPDETYVVTDFAGFSNETLTCEYSLSFQYERSEDADSGGDVTVVLVMVVLALILVLMGTALLVQAMSQQTHEYDIMVEKGIEGQGEKLGQYKPRRSSWFRTGGTEKEKMKDDNVENENVKVLNADATVVYATLDGFCEWSAKRDAEDTFALLDHLNSTFDRLVMEHKLSKVDTVGSSFMAVCGVRQQRDDHARAAAEFSQEFFRTSADLTGFVEDSTLEELGISLKAGIHSGEVEASFHKSGFQLSGNTVKEVLQIVAQAEGSTILVSSGAHKQLIGTDLSKFLRTKENAEDEGVRHSLDFSPDQDYQHKPE